MAKSFVEHVAQQLDALAAPVRKDSHGNPVPFGVEGAPRAPGLIRQRGDAPYSFARVIKGLLEGDVARVAPFEHDISVKLQQLGYAPSVPRGAVMTPMGADLIWETPGHESEAESLQRVVKASFPRVSIDLEEYRRIKKVMSPLDDSAGG